MKIYFLLTLLVFNVKVFCQRTYEVIIKDDSTYWDTQTDYLKTKKIIIPPNNLTKVEIKISDRLRNIIDAEVAYNLEDFKKAFSDFPANPVLKENRINYQTPEGLSIIHSLITVNYEHTEIAVLIIIDKNKEFVYSESNKLGEEIKLYSLKKEGLSYKLYGHFQGNPESVYGGDFCLTFDKKKRILEYSYYEKGG